jgi:hypothetical protein
VKETKITRKEGRVSNRTRMTSIYENEKAPKKRRRALVYIIPAANDRDYKPRREKSRRL